MLVKQRDPDCRLAGAVEAAAGGMGSVGSTVSSHDTLRGSSGFTAAGKLSHCDRALREREMIDFTVGSPQGAGWVAPRAQWGA